MKIRFGWVLTIILSMNLFGLQVIPLPDLTKPLDIQADNDQLYIIDGHRVYIYSIRTLKKKAVFGQPGEGPGEFKINASNLDLQIHLTPQKDTLFVYNMARMLYFSKRGSFLKQQRVNRNYLILIPVANHFIAQRIKRQPQGVSCFSTGIFDGDMRELAEIASRAVNNPRRPRKKSENRFRILKTPPFTVRVTSRNIYLLNSTDAIIRVFNSEGRPLTTLRYPYRRIAVSPDDRQAIFSYYKTHPIWRRRFTQLKKRMDIAKIFPAFRTFFIDKSLIYLESYERSARGIVVLASNLQGQVLGRFLLPIRHQNFLKPWPHVIRNHKLYQLVNNDDDVWELHMTSIPAAVK